MDVYIVLSLYFLELFAACPDDALNNQSGPLPLWITDEHKKLLAEWNDQRRLRIFAVVFHNPLKSLADLFNSELLISTFVEINFKNFLIPCGLDNSLVEYPSSQPFIMVFYDCLICDKSCALVKNHFTPVYCPTISIMENACDSCHQMIIDHLSPDADIDEN